LTQRIQNIEEYIAMNPFINVIGGIIFYTGWPKKSKPPPIFQNIALKIANEIRFLRKVKV